MKKDCWCPVCGQRRRAGKVRWMWFWIFFLFFTPLFPIYLIYCLLCSRRVCEICHRREAYIVKEEEQDDEE